MSQEVNFRTHCRDPNSVPGEAMRVAVVQFLLLPPSLSPLRLIQLMLYNILCPNITLYQKDERSKTGNFWTQSSTCTHTFRASYFIRWHFASSHSTFFDSQISAVPPDCLYQQDAIQLCEIFQSNKHSVYVEYLQLYTWNKPWFWGI
jgi:hypothetical protein